jgi:hypothetical protein
MKPKTINLNSEVSVKLTPEGIACYKQFYLDLFKDHPSYADNYPLTNGDTFEGPLHELANIFGPHLSVGAEPVLATMVMTITYEVK